MLSCGVSPPPSLKTAALAGEPGSSVARHRTFDVNGRSVHRGEDEPVDDPPAAGRRIGEQAHPPEVDLELLPGLTVGHPDGRGPPAEAELGDAVPVEGPVRDRETVAGEERLDLREAQTLLEPGLELVAATARVGLPNAANRASPSVPKT